ncbi:MAG: ABC transporter permease [bacterium]|nr:ABC transporter permease [bacterium]
MIEIERVSKTYGRGDACVHALRDVSLRIEQGEFVAIMGPSGSGKSTLLHIIGCLDRPDGGAFRLDGTDLTRLSDDALAGVRNRMIGFVFQQFHLLPFADAVENVDLPLVYAGRSGGDTVAAARLADVGLAARASHRPSEMSGGEQQRVAIARALVNDPPVILADEPTGNLDTKSEAEIVALLEAMHRGGRTIVMVTHEPSIARHAGRIVRMRDGRIIADERTEPRDSGPLPPAPPLPPGAARAHAGRAMFRDHLRQALRAIATHPMRSVLSTLGILIGVAAVIAMLALGRGARQSIEARLASMGSNLLQIRPGGRRRGGVVLEAGTVTRFTLQDAEAIGRLPQIRRVAPSVTGRGQTVFGNRNWNTMIEGTGTEYEEIRAARPPVGRFFTPEEVRVREKVALVGATVVRELFEGADPIGAVIRINRINFRVIGILPEKGATGWRDQDDTIIIPITTAMYRLLGKDYVDAIFAEVADPGLMAEAEEAIRELVIRRHRLTGDTADSFQIRNMAEIQEALVATTRTMTWLLGSIAAISLLVGGIGIMNIMLVSVTERTREIGLRKAIGARGSDIMAQFVIESAVMTLSGGLAGVLCGIGTALLMARLAGWAVLVSTSAVALAVSFSVAVGLVFGIWPARRAAGLNPIEALRYE